MNDIFDAVDHHLNVHYKYSTQPDVKPLMNDKQKAMCLAEIVFASLFFSDHGKNFKVDEYTLDCLAEKVPLLVAHSYTGFYAFGSVDIAAVLSAGTGETVHTDANVLGDEEQATEDLCEEIETNAEVALICWNLAKQIAAVGWWKQGDYTYDCMVQVELLPMYEGFEAVCEVTAWEI